MSCYCGANNSSYSECCLPFITSEKLPGSPEQLMRSRYSAYATKNANYILRTYASSKQQEHSLSEIEDWANVTIWLKLIITEVITPPITSSNDTTLPTVTFKAFYLHDKRFYLLHECSRFIKEQDSWRYLDGTIICHSEISPPDRNAVCFCESGKKFKKCCAAFK